MPQISVIVPVYNVEKYLHRCVDSILTQTFSDFELILVDDGSPDNCGKICDEYVQKDKRIKVVHKKNGGLSSARNAGMKVATGEYILFCDSDDFVHPQWCEFMLSAIEEHKNSFIVCGYKKTSNDCVDSQMYQLSYKKTEYFKIFKRGISGSVCNKIYNFKTIKENAISFDENCKFAEDVPFNSLYLRHCDSCYLFDYDLYYYYENHDSIMNTYYLNWLGYHLNTFY